MTKRGLKETYFIFLGNENEKYFKKSFFGIHTEIK